MGSGEVRDSASEGKRGVGSSALFVARNRFAVLDKTAQTIEIRDLENGVTKTIKCPAVTGDIFFGGTGCLLLSCPASVILFDIQQQKVLAELATPLVKYVVWSNDNAMVALLSKHSEWFLPCERRGWGRASIENKRLTSPAPPRPAPSRAQRS